MIYIALRKYRYDNHVEEIIKVCSSYELAVKAIVENLQTEYAGWRSYDTAIETHEVDVTGYISKTYFTIDENKQMILEHGGSLDG